MRLAQAVITSSKRGLGVLSDLLLKIATALLITFCTFLILFFFEVQRASPLPGVSADFPE
jgi:hypothetical protein